MAEHPPETVHPDGPAAEEHGHNSTQGDSSANGAQPLPASLGAYELLSLIGSDELGTRYTVRHLLTERTGTLKLFNPALSAIPGLLDRLRHEVHEHAELVHPGVDRLLDAGEEGDTRFLVSEPTLGADLETVVRAGGPLPAAMACSTVREAANALRHVHEKGLVHGRLTPARILLTREGQVKLAGFGLAFAPPTGEDDAAVAAGEYCAPERWDSKSPPGPAADLYSLGCTLQFLLTGSPPFGARGCRTGGEQRQAHQNEAPAPLALQGDNRLQGLAELVDRLLAKDPSQRFSSAAELSTALTEVLMAPPLPPEPVVAPAPEPIPAPMQVPATADAAPAEQPLHEAPSSSLPAPADRVAETVVETESNDESLEDEPTDDDDDEVLPVKRRSQLLIRGLIFLALMLPVGAAAAHVLSDSKDLVALTRQNANRRLIEAGPSAWRRPKIPASVDALKIEPLRIMPFRPGTTPPDMKKYNPSEFFGCRVGDSLRIEVRFNVPSSYFVLAYKPDGTEVLLDPVSEDDVPEFKDGNSFVITADANGPGALTSQPGWLFIAAVGTRAHLVQSFERWQNHCGATPWKRLALVESTAVWHQSSEMLLPEPEGLSLAIGDTTMQPLLLLSPAVTQGIGTFPWATTWMTTGPLNPKRPPVRFKTVIDFFPTRDDIEWVDGVGFPVYPR